MWWDELVEISFHHHLASPSPGSLKSPSCLISVKLESLCLVAPSPSNYRPCKCTGLPQTGGKVTPRKFAAGICQPAHLQRQRLTSLRTHCSPLGLFMHWYLFANKEIKKHYRGQDFFFFFFPFLFLFYYSSLFHSGLQDDAMLLDLGWAVA